MQQSHQPHMNKGIAHLQHRHIKGAATQVEDQDGLVGLLLKAVRERGRGRLVDDSKHLQSSDAAGVLCGLPLRIIKVGWHCDHRLVHLDKDHVIISTQKGNWEWVRSWYEVPERRALL